MKDALKDFRKGISELVSFLNRADAEQKLIAALSSHESALSSDEQALLAQLRETSTSAKQYIYSVGIVSLYGLLEQVTDKLVHDYAQLLGKACIKYANTPEVFQNNHLSFSLNLISEIQSQRCRLDISEKEVVSNLHSCLSGAYGFSVNAPAFVMHRGNLNLERISTMLANIGIPNYAHLVFRTPSFIEFLKKRDPDADLERLPDEDRRSLFLPVDDLVERRNLVSHGEISNDIQSTEILRSRCDFICAYCTAIHDILWNKLLEMAAIHGRAAPLGKPIQVISHKIVCLEARNEISLGDFLFATTGDTCEPVRSSEIFRLQVSGKDANSIFPSTPTKFGAEVAFYAKENYEYFLLRKDCFYG